MFLNAFTSDDGSYWTGFFIISAIVLAIAIPTLIEFLATGKIIIGEDGITNIAVFTNKKTLIKYSDIERFGSVEVRPSRVRGTAISDSYMQTVVYLKNGRMLVISPDCYENYPALNRALLENYHKD